VIWGGFAGFGWLVGKGGNHLGRWFPPFFRSNWRRGIRTLSNPRPNTLISAFITAFDGYSGRIKIPQSFLAGFRFGNRIHPLSTNVDTTTQPKAQRMRWSDGFIPETV
jgi:hypothetical protein